MSIPDEVFISIVRTSTNYNGHYKWLEVQVQDEGIGIPAEIQQKLFKPFGFFDLNGMNSQGIGLGLHITKMITKQFDGNISCQSKEQEGSTFTFLFQLDGLSHVTDIQPSHNCNTLVRYQNPYRKEVEYPKIKINKNRAPL